MTGQADFFGGRAPARSERVILSYGMGVDSSAILTRWLDDPSSRNFDLSQLTVLTAQVGEEHESTAALVEANIYPRLREAKVRTVEVARAGKSVRDGLVVLQDTTYPRVCHIKGAYRLSQEWLSAGTVPTFAGDKRLCTLKAKGAVLDAWLEKDLAGAPFRSVIGFAADEPRRVARDKSFQTTQRTAEHPLVEWGWERSHAEAYLQERYGVRWLKSACTACPYAAGKCEAMGRLREEIEGAVTALLVERVAMAMNPKMTLYRKKSLAGCFGEEEGEPVLEALEAKLDSLPWAVYRVRRWYELSSKVLPVPAEGEKAKKPKKMSGRKTELLARGTRQEMEAAVRAKGAREGRPVVEDEGGLRVYQRACGDVLPAVEEFVVAAPALADEKGLRGFEAAWERLTGSDLWGEAMVRAA